MPEPLRGGQSRLEPGVVDLAAARGRRPQSRATAPTRRRARAARDDDLAREAARRHGVEPDPELVLERGSRGRWGSVDAVRYILSIPTNMLLIISSSLGYFFFSGLSTFALLFVRGHYHASQADGRAGARRCSCAAR